jgi:hypothetical protein
MRVAKSLLITGWVSSFSIPISTLCAPPNPLSIPIQLTHPLNYATAAAPDGKRLVKISVIAGKGQIFVMNADSSNSVQITWVPRLVHPETLGSFGEPFRFPTLLLN